MFGRKKDNEIDFRFYPNVEIKRPTPNCALCQWESIMIANEDIISVCSAQGMKLQNDVYNNTECKELYMEDPIKTKAIIDNIESEIPHIDISGIANKWNFED